VKGDAQALAEFEVVRYKAIVKEKFQGSDTEESNFHHNQGHKRQTQTLQALVDNARSVE